MIAERHPSVRDRLCSIDIYRYLQNRFTDDYRMITDDYRIDGDKRSCLNP
jgi:hypothetical protein